MSNETTLAQYEQALNGYETTLGQQEGRIRGLGSDSTDVGGIIALIAKEMPASSEFTALETRISNLEKGGGFSGQKTTANNVLTRVRELRSGLDDIKGDLSVLEGSK